MLDKNKEFNIGDFVQFDSQNGSTGKIIGKHRTLKDYFYAEWQFGKDARGEPVTAISSGLSSKNLIHCTKEQYDWHCQREFNSGSIYNKESISHAKG